MAQKSTRTGAEALRTSWSKFASFKVRTLELAMVGMVCNRGSEEPLCGILCRLSCYKVVQRAKAAASRAKILRGSIMGSSCSDVSGVTVVMSAVFREGVGIGVDSGAV